MSKQLKQITKTFTAIKAADIGVEDNGLWALASVEIEDTAGDIVRIKGISYKDYHDPDRGVHLKILAQHLKVLPDGSPPIVGRVEEFRQLTYKGTPALAFRMSWATDGEGNVTDLAKKYKDLYDGGYLDSFSVGMGILEMSPIKDAGYDFTKSELYEISAVTLPANRLASVMRAVECSIGGYLDKDTVLLSLVQELTNKVESGYSLSKGIEGSLNATLVKQFEKLHERLDYLESSIVAKSETVPPVTGNRKAEQLSRDNALAGLKSELNKILSK